MLYLALHQRGPSQPLDSDNAALLKKAALVVRAEMLRRPNVA